MFAIPPHPVALSSMLADTESEELQRFKENRQILKESFESKLEKRGGLGRYLAKSR